MSATPKNMTPTGWPLDQIVELALIVAHDDRAAVDQRDRGIGGERDRALVHHRDLGCHPLRLATAHRVGACHTARAIGRRPSELWLQGLVAAL